MFSGFDVYWFKVLTDSENSSEEGLGSVTKILSSASVFGPAKEFGLAVMMRLTHGVVVKQESRQRTRS